MQPYAQEFRRYKRMLEEAVAQLDDEALFTRLGPGENAVADLWKHLSGNLRSRFTNFLSEDGEKPWREREAEFDASGASRSELEHAWREAWAIVEREALALGEADRTRRVTIRGVGFSVEEALARSLAHLAYHVGQIVLLGRHLKGPAWRFLTIPPGQSARYNQNPDKERG
ncbi:DUF1572 family protein [Oceanithermus profundus]|uniref:DUF1572 domain-containing protein n=1 Tax=Oceanithermus profundus (strain DSM 14977 / NBRC 100410 / VKM B-2274 / 506) TaxID=670487 RepID=E4U657_OCEP5|nr:DUF1572 family protein [Oceanithermus profundus]ADR35930.1 hypothetical protein Ocepr_0471 [Oceanithermus profundus DSM 14977]